MKFEGEGANLNFTGANLSGAILAGNNGTLRGDRFAGANLNFFHACVGLNRPISLPPNWKFSYTSTCLVGPGVNLSHTNLICANLSNLDLEGADFAEAGFGPGVKGQTASGANIMGGVTNFSGSNLKGADLIGTNLSGTVLTNVQWSSNTICPNGSHGQCAQ